MKYQELENPWQELGEFLDPFKDLYNKDTHKFNFLKIPQNF